MSSTITTTMPPTEVLRLRLIASVVEPQKSRQEQVAAIVEKIASAISEQQEEKLRIWFKCRVSMFDADTEATEEMIADALCELIVDFISTIPGEEGFDFQESVKQILIGVLPKDADADEYIFNYQEYNDELEANARSDELIDETTDGLVDLELASLSDTLGESFEGTQGLLEERIKARNARAIRLKEALAPFNKRVTELVGKFKDIKVGSEQGVVKMRELLAKAHSLNERAKQVFTREALDNL